MGILVCCLLIALVLSFLLFRPVLIGYIRKNGVETTATLRFLNPKYDLTTSNGQGGARVSHTNTSCEVCAKYKVKKVRYQEKPLNPIRGLEYQSRQPVTIKYLKSNPKYFIVIGLQDKAR